MKKICLLLSLLLAMGGSAMAATVAHWDFSGGTNGVSLPYATDGSFVLSAEDISGNGNDLSIWADSDTSDRTWIATTNSYFGDIAVQSPGGQASYGDMRTVSNTAPAGVDISASTFTPTNFTTEAVFTYEQAGWQVLTVRHGNLASGPSFRMVINSSSQPYVAYRTEAGTQTDVTSPTPLEIDPTTWHHMAASVTGGSNLVLYVDGIEVASGSVTNSGMEFDPNSGAGTDQGNTWVGGEWAVGRGMWTGGKSDAFPGKIDEVVISDEALVPTNFVAPLQATFGAVVPANGGFETNRTISATINDFGDHIDQLLLFVNDNLIISTNTVSSNRIHTITYEGTPLEFPYGSYTGMVVGVSFGTGNSYTNEWTFNFIDSFPEPALYASELYNVNLAGCLNNGLRLVPNGYSLAAPTTGGVGRWNNINAPDAPWSSAGLTTVVGANNFSTNTVNFETGGSGWWDGPQSWAGYFTEFTALSNTIWGATVGDSDAGWTRFTGLDTNATYDVYIYWTWNRADDTKTFQLTAGTSQLPLQTIATDRAALVADPDNLVEGQNYVVLADITPDASGTIELGPNYSCGYQLVKRSDVPVIIIVPFLDGPVFPANGSRLTNSVVNLSGTIYDDDAGVEEMSLYLDGNLVTNAIGLYTATPNTNTLEYAATSLANGVHTGMVTAVGYGFASGLPYLYTNEWTFSWFDHFATPAPYASEVYSLNFAGNTADGARTVPDGTILAAPNNGAFAVWNNWISPGNPWDYPPQPVNLADEFGDTDAGVTFTYSGDSWNDGPQSWAGYYTEFLAMTNTIWGATQGDVVDDGNCEFNGLEDGATYDVYIYFTFNRDDGPQTYTLSKGTANVPGVSINPDRLLLVSNSTAYVEGVNYGVIPEVTPDVTGAIAVSQGNYAALQLVKRSDAPPFIPYAGGEFLPEAGYYTTNAVDISGSLIDVDATVDEMYLLLNGVEVDSVLGGYGAGTTTVSYAATSLTNGQYTAMVAALGYGLTNGLAYNYTNEWTFFVSLEESVPTTLMHHWNFMDASGTGVADVTGGANGTIIGTNFAWNIEGGLKLLGGGSSADWNGGTNFSAGSYVDLPNNIMNSFTNEITIEAAYISENTENLQWARVYTFGASNGGEDISDSGAGQVYLTSYDNGGNVHVEYSAMGAITAPRVPVGDISHVVWVLDPDNYYTKCYVNGQLAGTLVGPVAPVSDLNDINNWFGRSQWGDNMFKGDLLDIRIYEGIMTESEAAARYEVLVPDTGPEFGPVVSISGTDGLSISWPDDGYSYTVWTNKDLMTGTWGDMAVTPVLDGGVYTVTNLISDETELFYVLQYSE